MNNGFGAACEAEFGLWLRNEYLTLFAADRRKVLCTPDSGLKPARVWLLWFHMDREARAMMQFYHGVGVYVQKDAFNPRWAASFGDDTSVIQHGMFEDSEQDFRIKRPSRQGAFQAANPIVIFHRKRMEAFWEEHRAAIDAAWERSETARIRDIGLRVIRAVRGSNAAAKDFQGATSAATDALREYRRGPGYGWNKVVRDVAEEIVEQGDPRMLWIRALFHNSYEWSPDDDAALAFFRSSFSRSGSSRRARSSPLPLPLPASRRSTLSNSIITRKGTQRPTSR